MCFDIDFGTGIVCMVFSALAVLAGHSNMYVYSFSYWLPLHLFYVKSCVCQSYFSFFSILVGTPTWVVQVFEMPRRECL